MTAPIARLVDLDIGFYIRQSMSRAKEIDTLTAEVAHLTGLLNAALSLMVAHHVAGVQDVEDALALVEDEAAQVDLEEEES